MVEISQTIHTNITLCEGKRAELRRRLTGHQPGPYPDDIIALQAAISSLG